MKNQIFEVEIERILPGGLGLAHAEGLTLFVSLAAPGDLVRVEVERTKGKIGFAKIKEIVEPSAARIDPPCPYFGRCGGCDFQQLEYTAQLNAKIEIINDCLHRIAKLATIPPIAIEPSPEQWHYRSRTTWQLDSGYKRLGYFEGGSHRICDVEFCAVLVPELQSVLETLRLEMRNGVVEDFSGEIDAVCGDEGVSVAPPLGGFETAVISRKVAGETYEINAESFFQINHALLEKLIAEAVDDSRGSLAVDLYSGVGLFTVPLARRFDRVIAVESNPVAVRCARRNLDHAQLANAEVIGSRVTDWLLRSQGVTGEVDLLLLDPPRSGVEASGVDAILTLKPKEISYVSCDPATLARDLKQILAGGYALDSARAFDLFPQTHHVETVVRLTVR